MGIRRLLKSIIPQSLHPPIIRVAAKADFFRHYSIQAILRGYAFPLPSKIRIEPASACNLRCRHCPTGMNTALGKRDGTVMSEEVFDIIVSQLANLPSIVAATFYVGGEPLLNRRLPEMLRRIKQETHVRKTSFNTNGMVLSDALCERLADSGVDSIGISIDGRSPGENDAIRIGSNYEKIRENVEKLKKALPNTKISIHNIIFARPGEINEHLTPEVPEFLIKDFGVGNVSSSFAIKWPGLEENYLNNQGVGLEKNSKHITTHGWGFCLHPFTQFNILADGRISVCCYDIMDRMIMGDITKERIEDVWCNEKYRRLRRAIATFSLLGELSPICRQCPVYTGEMLTEDQGESA